MGLIFGFALVGLLVYGAFAFVFMPEKRIKFLAEFQSKPLEHIGLAIWLGFFLAFFLGVLIHPLGKVRVYLGTGWLPLWQVCGIGLLAGLLVVGIWESVTRRR